MAQLAISPLEEKDVPQYARIELEAFRTHPRIAMLWRRGYTDDLYAFYESEKRDSLRDPDCRIIKAVDEDTGEIVAVAEWSFRLDPAHHSVHEEEAESNAAPPANWPIDGNWELRRFFNQNLQKWKKDYLQGKAYIKLDILVTNPDFQKRGAGSKLLAWGVEQADKHGALMCLEATPAGLSLYKKFGFQERDIIKADMRAFGWDKPYDEDAAARVWMIRQPVERVDRVRTA